MELNQSTNHIIYRAWNRGRAKPGYMYFSDYETADFTNKEDLIRALDDYCGDKYWQDYVQLHEISVTETRIS